jgi:hypothetical protein
MRLKMIQIIPVGGGIKAIIPSTKQAFLFVARFAFQRVANMRHSEAMLSENNAA